MTRAMIAVIACTLAPVVAGDADATLTETGLTADATPPSCPSSPCLVVSRTTGYQAKIGVQRSPVSVPRAGRIVAWSITQGTPTVPQIRFFDATEGGTARAAIAVLRPGPHLNFTLVGQGPVVHLQPYFGKTVQFPLETTLAVNAGDVIALTVPTWTPALALGFGHDTSWRASRGRGACAQTDSPSTHTAVGSTVQYYCLYGTARLTYSATLITTP